MEAVVEWSDLYDGFYGNEFEDEAESRVGISDYSQQPFAAIEAREFLEALQDIGVETEQSKHSRTEERKKRLNRNLQWCFRPQRQAYRKGVTRAREAIKAIREADKKKSWMRRTEEKTKRLNEVFCPSPALVFWRQQFGNRDQSLERPGILFRKF